MKTVEIFGKKVSKKQLKNLAPIPFVVGSILSGVSSILLNKYLKTKKKKK